MLECVINVSEGRRAEVIEHIASADTGALLDVHRDADHHRSVITLAGVDVEDAARAVARRAVELLDLRAHAGAHPRIGVVDVVPFVPLRGASMDHAVAARDRFAAWAGDTLSLPCFLYGPERSLPDVRRGAFTTLRPDHGPSSPHATAGATAVGARPVLVAYNVWLKDPDIATARRIAAALRSPSVRALAFACGDEVQVSMNLLDPSTTGPAAVFDAVASRADVARAELVGLVPATVLAAVEPDRWSALDLSADRTIEARLERAGLDGGRFDRAPGPAGPGETTQAS